jgi:hypothetical protein
MIKHILVGSTVAALALGGFAVHSYGQSAPDQIVCRQPDMTGGTVKYDTHDGVTMTFPGFTAIIPLEVGGEPNPHFDRLYALAMKGFDSHRISEVCTDYSTPGEGSTRPVVSLTLRHPDALQRVRVCDSQNDCAGVSQERLLTTP